jgi:hypothetical protein
MNGLQNLVAESHSILAMWRNHFSKLLIDIGVIDVRHREIHAEEQLVSEPRTFEFELAIYKLKSYKNTTF